jgi:hypothetical protein
MKHQDELKSDVIDMLQQGTKPLEINTVTGVPLSTIYRWRKEVLDPKLKQPVAESDELLQLRQLVLSFDARIKELEAAIPKPKEPRRTKLTFGDQENTW